MLVGIGKEQIHSFEDPLGQLNDSHRRVEHYIKTLLDILRRSQTALSDSDVMTLRQASRFLHIGLPLHEQDEEHSILPRMIAADEEVIKKVLATQLSDLETDHQYAASLHEEIRRLVKDWTKNRSLHEQDYSRLRELMQEFQEIFARHISFEDNQLFPLAYKLLSPEDLEHIAEEMAKRRE